MEKEERVERDSKKEDQKVLLFEEDLQPKKKTLHEGSTTPVTLTMSPSSLCWEAYSDAYAKRYGEPPMRNAKVNAQLKHFVSRIPAEEAPQVAAFFVMHNNQHYVTRMHPVGLLLMDAEKLRTEWFTGRNMTSLEARSTEKKSALMEQFKRLEEKRKS